MQCNKLQRPKTIILFFMILLFMATPQVAKSLDSHFCAKSLLTSSAHSSMIPIFENMITAQTHPYIYEHVIFGQPILPGAAYVELLLDAAHRSVSKKSMIVKLENLKIRKAVPLNFNDSLRLQTVITFLNKKKDSFIGDVYASFHKDDQLNEVQVRAESGSLIAEWPSYQIGTAVPGLNVFEDAQVISSRKHYQWMNLIGLNYGTPLHLLEDSYISREFLASFIRAPNWDRTSFAIHPAVLDSAFHAVIALARSYWESLNGPIENTGVFVPVHFSEIFFDPSVDLTPGKSYLLRVKLLDPADSHLRAHFVDYQLEISNDLGVPILWINNGRFAALDPNRI